MTTDDIEDVAHTPSADVPLDKQMVGRTHAADVLGAVAVVGPWWRHLHPAGRLVRAIALQLGRRTPTRLQSSACAPLEDSDVSLAVVGQVGHLRNVASRETLAALRYVSLDRTDQVHGQLIPAATRWSMAAQRAALRYTIAIVEPETSVVAEEAADVLSMAAGVITTSPAAKRILVAAGVPKEHILVLVPTNIYEPEPVLARVSLSRDVELLETRHLGRFGAPFGPSTAPDGKRFYSIGTWHPGSGLAELVRDFPRAFSPSEASLELAVRETERWPGYPTVDEALTQAAASPGWSAEMLRKRVRILRREAMIPSQVLAMHVRNNIYVDPAVSTPALADWIDADFGGNAVVRVASLEAEERAGSHHAGPWLVSQAGVLERELRAAVPPAFRVCRRRGNCEGNTLVEFLQYRCEISEHRLNEEGVLP